MLESEIRFLKKAIKKGYDDPFLYTDEELRKLKTKLNQLRDWRRSAQISQNNGFGQYVQ